MTEIKVAAKKLNRATVSTANRMVWCSETGKLLKINENGVFEANEENYDIRTAS